jgi:type IV pilus assembly protein PilB
MATPPPNDPKKPNPGQNPGQKPGAQPQKPANATPAGGTPKVPPTGGAKPPAPGAKPPVPGAKPPAAGAPKPAPTPAPKKPAPPKNRFSHIDSNTRQLGQKFVDLGFMDDAQLEAIYEDMRTADGTLADLAKDRALVNEDQLLQATAELHGMRLVNLEETTPTPEAVKLVQKQMAELYKLVPISFENDTLTVAMSDPNNLQAMDDLKNLLGIRNVSPILAPAAQIEKLIERAYTGEKEESITSIYAMPTSTSATPRSSARRASTSTTSRNSRTRSRSAS